MTDIITIMDMFDWNMSAEIRLKGISSARNIDNMVPFIQPLTQKHWTDCKNMRITVPCTMQ